MSNYGKMLKAAVLLSKPFADANKDRLSSIINIFQELSPKTLLASLWSDALGVTAV